MEARNGVLVLDNTVTHLMSSSSASASGSLALPMTAFSQRLPPTLMAETTPVRMPIGAHEKIKFSSHEVL
jgi:hypothetical protein